MPFAEHINFVDLKTLLGWVAVIAGLSLFTWAIVLADRRSARLCAAPGKQQHPARCPHRDWELVTGIARTGLEQTDTAMALHTRAAERIDAAEYALNRLLAECTAVMGLPDAPTLQPVPVLSRGPSRLANEPLAV